MDIITSKQVVTTQYPIFLLVIGIIIIPYEQYLYCTINNIVCIRNTISNTDHLRIALQTNRLYNIKIVARFAGQPFVHVFESYELKVYYFIT